MSNAYNQTMSTERRPDPPVPKFGRMWMIAGASACVASFLWIGAYQTGSVVLPVAMWAALLSFGIVSYRRFKKRYRSENAPRQG